VQDHCLFCRLPDGRRLAYAEWGDPQGSAVFYCHGFPGSRLEARLGDRPAQGLGIRLIAPDRPGFGASPPCADRRLSDWPADLAVLADALGIGRFDLLGVSGGAPYALACGQHLGERVQRMAIVCGLGELADRQYTRGMNTAAAAGLRLYQHVPLIAHWAYARLIGPLLGRFPEQIFRILVGNAGPADREALADADVRRIITTSFGEAFRGGGEGPAQELGIFTRPWDIDVSQVTVPVQLWHGEADRTVPVAMGRRHARLLPNCEARFLPGEGHFSLIVRYLGQVLKALVQTPA
jgi:pimeloyl-ACP methyl ester carboxylesterase